MASLIFEDSERQAQSPGRENGGRKKKKNKNSRGWEKDVEAAARERTAEKKERKNTSVKGGKSTRYFNNKSGGLKKRHERKTYSTKTTKKKVDKKCEEATVEWTESEIPCVDVSTNLKALLARAGKNSDEHIDSVCRSALPKNLSAIIASLQTPVDFQRVFKIGNYPGKIFYTVGIHPLSSQQYDCGMLDDLKLGLKRQDVVGCGPIGIDYSTRCTIDPELQLECFVAQVKLAVSLSKPLVIYMRPELRYTEGNKRALKDVLAVLQEHVPTDYLIALHAYAGSAEAGVIMLKAFPNLYISFSGIITFAKAKHLRELAFDIPTNRFLLCSDGPWTPVSQVSITAKDDLSSEPSHIMFIADAIAKQKNLSLDEILICALDNSCRFFDTEFATSPVVSKTAAPVAAKGNEEENDTAASPRSSNPAPCS